MSPHRRSFPPLAWSLSLILLITAGCLGNDFENLSLVANEWDHGWMFAIEPEEHLEVYLQGNAAYPEAPWQVVEFDTAVVALEHQEH